MYHIFQKQKFSKIEFDYKLTTNSLVFKKFKYGSQQSHQKVQTITILNHSFVQKYIKDLESSFYKILLSIFTIQQQILYFFIIIIQMKNNFKIWSKLLSQTVLQNENNQIQDVYQVAEHNVHRQIHDVSTKLQINLFGSFTNHHNNQNLLNQSNQNSSNQQQDPILHNHHQSNPSNQYYCQEEVFIENDDYVQSIIILTKQQSKSQKSENEEDKSNILEESREKILELSDDHSKNLD